MLRLSSTQEESELIDNPLNPPIPEDPNTGFYYSDVLPVRVVAVTNFTTYRESDSTVTASTVFTNLSSFSRGRLNDPAQTGVLPAVVRGPNVRDATTLTSLVKALMLRQSTVYETAVMLRSGCIVLSMVAEC